MFFKRKKLNRFLFTILGGTAILFSSDLHQTDKGWIVAVASNPPRIITDNGIKYNKKTLPGQWKSLTIKGLEIHNNRIKV